MPQSLSAIYLHAVFSTKNRVPFLKTQVERENMFALLAAISYRMECPPVLVGGMEDHVHILFQLSRKVAPANWVKEVKRASCAEWKRRPENPADFAWQHGYGLFSVSASHLGAVETYIREQEKHHEKRSFQAEFRALLRRYGIEWNEEFVWD